MRRRDFVALVAGTLAMGSVKALAQSSTHRPLIAVLLGGSQTTVQRWLGGLPDELQSLGYVEHRNFEAEYRYADGDLLEHRLGHRETQAAQLSRHRNAVGFSGQDLIEQCAVGDGFRDGPRRIKRE